MIYKKQGSSWELEPKSNKKTVLSECKDKKIAYTYRVFPHQKDKFQSDHLKIIFWAKIW